MASNNHTHNINALGITVRNYQVSHLLQCSLQFIEVNYYLTGIGVRIWENEP